MHQDDARTGAMVRGRLGMGNIQGPLHAMHHPSCRRRNQEGPERHGLLRHGTHGQRLETMGRLQEALGGQCILLAQLNLP